MGKRYIPQNPEARTRLCVTLYEEGKNVDEIVKRTGYHPKSISRIVNTCKKRKSFARKKGVRKAQHLNRCSKKGNRSLGQYS